MRKGKGVRCVGGETEERKRNEQGIPRRENTPRTLPPTSTTTPNLFLSPYSVPIPPFSMRARKRVVAQAGLQGWGAQLWKAGGRGSLAPSPEQFSKLEEIQHLFLCPLLNTSCLGWSGWEPRLLAPGSEGGGHWGPGLLVPRERLEPALGAS